jgi:hypothetical protein
MQVIGFNGSAIQMDGQVGVVVVTDILTVHHQVLQFIGAWCQSYGSKCRHHLPEEDRQKNQGAKSAEHGWDFGASLALTEMGLGGLCRIAVVIFEVSSSATDQLDTPEG